MKNFTTSLHNGNLTPKERYLMLIHDDVKKLRKGKGVLTEADREALENWRAQDNNEVKEWNRYNEGWKYNARVDLDVELTFLEAQTEHLRKQPIAFNLLSYPFYAEIRRYIKRLEQMKKVTIQEAVEIAEKQKAVKLRDGMDFEYAVYQLAFGSLSDGDKKRFIDLYQEVEYEHQYLDQEEIIAYLFNGTDELTTEVKEKLANLIAENCYNKFAKEYQLFHYFACIPLAEVARQFLISKGIKIKGKLLAKNQESDDKDSETHDDIQEAIEKYAKENNITIEAILKESFLAWYDEAIIPFTPLIISNEKELLSRWLTAKSGARATLQKLIDNGELMVTKRPADKLYRKDLYDSELEKAKRALEVIGSDAKKKGSLDEKVITGESLYGFKGDYAFVKSFKERVNGYDANLGIVYADGDTDHKGDHLDQELLVCGLNGKGEPNIFSLFGISITRLEVLFETMVFFEEIEENGETFLKFKDGRFEESFKDRRKALIDGYAKLLAFDELLKKLSEIYEVDLTYRIKSQLQRLGNYIDSHNEALCEATGRTLRDGGDKDTHGAEGWLMKRKDVLNMKEDLTIDKDKIIPDKSATDDHISKFKEIFGSEFSMT